MNCIIFPSTLTLGYDGQDKSSTLSRLDSVDNTVITHFYHVLYLPLLQHVKEGIVLRRL